MDTIYNLQQRADTLRKCNIYQHIYLFAGLVIPELSESGSIGVFLDNDWKMKMFHKFVF